MNDLLKSGLCLPIEAFFGNSRSGPMTYHPNLWLSLGRECSHALNTSWMSPKPHRGQKDRERRAEGKDRKGSKSFSLLKTVKEAPTHTYLGKLPTFKPFHFAPLGSGTHSRKLSHQNF